MATGKLLRQLVKSGVEGNNVAFKEASRHVIEEERQKQHHLLANDLERILYGSQSRSQTTTQASRLALPSDREKNVPLLSVREPVRRLSDVVLADDTLSTPEEILQEHHHADRLASYGLRAADRLLFYGPPGCGKTVTAEVIA